MDFTYIIKRILIGTGIALAVWFIKDTCFAATTVDQYVYRTNYKNAVNCVHIVGDTYQCYPSGSNSLSSFTQFGNSTSGPKFFYQYYVRMGTPSTATSQFQANQTCTTTFDINYNPRNSQTTSTLESIPTFQYFDGSDYVDLNNGRMSIVRGSDDYSYKVSFTYTPTTQTRYIYVKLDLPEPVVRGSSSQAVNFRNGKTVCATSSTDTAIIEGTAQIVDSVEGVGGQVNDNLKDIHGLLQTFITKFDSSVVGDGTSPGTVGGSLDPYSSSGLEQKEGQIDWTVDDNAFDLDLTPFTGPMQFIWVQVNTFIGLDPLFMSAILVMLTLTFVALVVGRL